MTVEELKVLAEDGNVDAIYALGVHYNDIKNKKINFEESLYWLRLGIKYFNDPRCMTTACLIISISVSSKIAIAGGDYTTTEGIKEIQEAIDYGKRALELGANIDLTTMYEIRGKCYYHIALDLEEKGEVLEAIEKYLLAEKDLKYACDNSKVESIEGILLYAFSMRGRDKIRGIWPSDRSLQIHNMIQYALESDSSAAKNLKGPANLFLGIDYLQGVIVDVDYNKAYQYLSKANELGIDCQETLRKFKKKLFGGYTFSF